MTRLAPLLLLLGCAVSEDAFPDAYGRAICTRLQECQRAEYESRYEDRADCVSAWSEIADSVLDAGDLLGATYSPSSAGSCLRAIRSASCSEFADFQYECEVFE